MRWMAILIFMASFGACAQQSPDKLEPLQFDSMLSADTALVLLDIRTPEEFATGYIEGALNLDFYSPKFSEEVSKLSKDTVLLLYCLSGSRSEEAAKILRSKGYQIIELKGGMAAWRASNLPVEGGIAQVKQLDKTREKFLSELDSNTLYLVDFHAEWCLPCRQLLPLVEKLDSLYGSELSVKKVNFDSHRQLSSDFKVEGLPYLLLIRNAQVLWSNFGLPTEEELKKAIDSHR